MRIESYSSLAGGRHPRAKGKPDGGAFTLSDTSRSGTVETSAEVSAGQSVSLGSLIALQLSDEDTVERKATRSGRFLLNDLDDLQAALLSGSDAPEVLTRLKQRLPELRKTGDARLDPILQEIELRARVELAKRGL